MPHFSVDLSKVLFVSFVALLLSLLTLRHVKPGDFTPGQRMPASVVLNYKDGVYAIDSGYSERDDPDKNVLTWLVSLKSGREDLQLTQFAGYAAREVSDDASRRIPPAAS